MPGTIESNDMDPRAIGICIIGAGMGGLSSALALAREGFKNIDVYEYAPNLGFVGAGIQMAPNMARILSKLGVWDDIHNESVQVADTSIRRGPSDSELAHVDLSHIPKQWDFPHTVGHRSTLAHSLYEGCKREASIRFHFSVSVSDIDLSNPEAPSFQATPQDGSQPERVSCDLLLGADGVKSRTRGALLSRLGEEEAVQDSGQAAYRIMLTREQMSSDPELVELINTNRVTRWVGDRKHIIAYPISRNQIYNISSAQPDTNFAAAPSSLYTTKGSKSSMLSVFSDFCPRVQKLLNMVPDGEVCEWKLRIHAPLSTWVYGSTALIGDACHPTLPHMNQGAAQAIEDGAAVALAFKYIPDSSPATINKALKLYEKIRKERAEKLVDIATANGKAMQLTAGEAREARDRQFAALKAGKGTVPDRSADAETQAYAYSDCISPAVQMVKDAFAVS